ncbi:hypothetical protein JCM6882_008389 [Rhodosporidiobolus microsporus]
MARRGFHCQYLPLCMLSWLALACIALNGWLLFPPSPLPLGPLSFALCAVNLLAIKLVTETDGDEELAYVAAFAGRGCIHAILMGFVRIATFGLEYDEQRTALASTAAVFLFVVSTIAMCDGFSEQEGVVPPATALETTPLLRAEQGGAAPRSATASRAQVLETGTDAAKGTADTQTTPAGAPPSYSAVVRAPN